MRKTGVLIVAMFLACPTFAANESREQKRLEACGQVFKEIMDIPDGIPKDLLNKAECVIVIPTVLKFAVPIVPVRTQKKHSAQDYPPVRRWVLKAPELWRGSFEAKANFGSAALFLT